MSIVAETPEAVVQPQDEISVVTSPDQAEWQEGVRLEANIFIEKDYVESAIELEEEYRPHLPTTEFAVVKRDGQVAGSTRLIHYSPSTEFKTLHDINTGRLVTDEAGQQALSQIDLERTFEVGTLAVLPKMRSRPEDEGRIAVGLYGAILAEARHHDAPHILASFDADYFERFKGIFGPGVQALGPATDYMGSPTIPVLMNADTLIDHLRDAFPDMYNQLADNADTMTHP